MLVDEVIGFTVVNWPYVLLTIFIPVLFGVLIEGYRAYRLKLALEDNRSRFAGGFFGGVLLRQSPDDIAARAAARAGRKNFDLHQARYKVFVLVASIALLCYATGAADVPKTALKTSLLEPPFEIRVPTSQAVGEAHRTAIVLFHGWTGNADDTWNQFSKILLADERFDDVDIWGVNYPTYISTRHLTLIELANWLDKRFFETSKITRYDRVYIIAHSLGGVVARQMYVLSAAASGQVPRVRLIISIASPFNGAPLASLANAIGVNLSYLEEVGLDSRYLRGLSVSWERAHPKPRSVCLWSPFDGVVERASAEYQCEETLSFPQWKHTELEKPTDQNDSRYVIPTQEIWQDMTAPAAKPVVPE